MRIEHAIVNAFECSEIPQTPGDEYTLQPSIRTPILIVLRGESIARMQREPIVDEYEFARRHVDPKRHLPNRLI